MIKLIDIGYDNINAFNIDVLRVETNTYESALFGLNFGPNFFYFSFFWINLVQYENF